MLAFLIAHVSSNTFFPMSCVLFYSNLEGCHKYFPLACLVKKICIDMINNIILKNISAKTIKSRHQYILTESSKKLYCIICIGKFIKIKMNESGKWIETMKMKKNKQVYE